MADRMIAKETLHAEGPDGTTRIVLAGQEVADGDWILEGRMSLFEAVSAPTAETRRKPAKVAPKSA